MAIQEHACWSLHCDRCGDECWDDGIPHFDSRQEALNYVKDSWIIRGDTMLCGHCGEAAGCEMFGHQLGDWKQNTHPTGVPYRTRGCECGQRSEWDPPSDEVFVLIDTALAIQDVEEGQ